MYFQYIVQGCVREVKLRRFGLDAGGFVRRLCSGPGGR